MRFKWLLLGVVVLAGVGYLASPYVALYRLATAIRGADAPTLQAMVDWYSVREGIKEDVCDLGGGAPAGKLPPFGASFVQGIASNAVDRAVTPQALLAAVKSAPASPAKVHVHVGWAFFDGLSSFLVSLKVKGEKEPIRLLMVLRDGGWRVHRVWLPDDMLSSGAKA